MKMHEIKPESYKEMSVPTEAKMYPRLCLKIKDVPEIKEWEVGDEYVVTLKVKMTSYSEHDRGGSADFDVLAVGVGGELEEKPMKSSKKVSRYEEKDAEEEDEE